MISLIRIRNGYYIEKHTDDMPKVASHHLLPVKEDSDYLDQLIASLNYKVPLEFPENNYLQNKTEQLISDIEDKQEIHYYTYEEFHKEIYAYLYKCLIKNKLAYYFYDDKLDDTKYELPELYECIASKNKQWEAEEGFGLTDHQISVICLIVERFAIRNRISGMNKQKIIIITNSSVEKVNFFLEVLSQHVNYEMVQYLTINELYKLEELTFDKILTFSNRITVLLAELGWESIKLNFYLSSNEIKKLLDNGFASSRNRKVIAQKIVAALDARSDTDDKIEYLKEKYPDIMI